MAIESITGGLPSILAKTEVKKAPGAEFGNMLMILLEMLTKLRWMHQNLLKVLLTGIRLKYTK